MVRRLLHTEEIRSSILRGPKLKNTMTDKQFECTKLKAELSRILTNLAKHQIEEIRTLVHQTYVKRFKRSRIPKYGNLNKGFTDYELQKFFKVIDNDKFRLLFSYQAQLGLRIGEAVKLNIKDINLQTRELTLKTEKARVIDTLLIPVQLFKQTLDFLNSNIKQIEKAQGYIFFKDCSSASKLPYLKMDYVRNRFRYYVEQADIDQVYDISDESYQNHVPRRLHRLTTHSLRHYAITSFSKQTNGNIVLTSRFARHADTSTTMVYVSTKKEELYKEIDNTFSLQKVQSLKNRIFLEL